MSLIRGSRAWWSPHATSSTRALYTEQFWRAGQRDDAADWKYLLTTGRSVVFNFEGLGERAVSDVAQLIMFTLRSAIQDHCKGFQQRGSFGDAVGG